MDDLELQVRQFVSDKCCVRLARVHLTSTLGEDFGIDGDDAVVFFDAYAETFQVDITAVRAEWSTFFGPEAGGNALLFLGPLVLASILSHVGRVFGFRLLSELEFAIVAVVGGVLLPVWARRRFWPLGELFPLKRQITVADLIEAARRGRW